MSRKPHQRAQCPQRFKKKQSLTQHIRDTHSQLGLVPNPSSSPQRSDTDARVLCPYSCGRDFKGNSGLTHHLRKDVACRAEHIAWPYSQGRGSSAEPNTPPDDNPPTGQEPEHGNEGGGGNDNDNDRRSEGRDQSGNEGEVEGGSGDEGDGMGEDDSETSDSETSDSEPEKDSDEQTISDRTVRSDIGGADVEFDVPDYHADPHMPPDVLMEGGGAGREVELEEVVENGRTIYIEQYPCPTVGEPIRMEPRGDSARQYPDVGKLANRDIFEIAHVLMESGVSGRMRNRFLKLKKFRDTMPWKNNRELLKDVDKLPHGANWTVQAMEIEGDRGVEVVEYWSRDALQVLKDMVANKQSHRYMHWAPIKKWMSSDRKEQIRDEAFTSDFMCGDKKAHPIYITTLNREKHIRRRISKRANVLLGYLPVPKMDCQSDQEKRRVTRRDLFHQCLEQLLAPLAEACKTGVEVLCGDGGVRRIYPVLASYIADFPEQCKVACTKITHCPTCTVKPEQRGDLGNAPLRTREGVIAAMVEDKTTGSAKFRRLGLYNVKPFWESYPYVDIGCLLTPDLLHQLHKGVMKDHLMKWAAHILKKQVVDERHTTMPEYHGMRHFKNGISAVSQWTGRELKEMVKVLLPVMSDANAQVVTAARALLDYMYLAHSSSLTDGELDGMETALQTFHENKAVFRQEGAVKTKKGFHGIPKIHMIQHYVHLIRELGTPDGYNTETSERLHIDVAKLGYRASNKVNYVKQMALYIQRMEAIAMHAAYLAERTQRLPRSRPSEDDIQDEDDIDDLDIGEEDEERDEWYEEEEEDPEELQDAGAPTTSGVTLDYLEDKHDATKLVPALRSFLRKENARSVDIPRSLKLNIWTRARLFHAPPPFKPSEGPHVDVIRAQPEKIDLFERVSRPARFDTVLILMNEEEHGVHRYRPGRVRIIFELPSKLRHLYDGKLVYVEMFNEFSYRPTRPTGLFTASHSMSGGSRVCAVVPLTSIRMTCHLAPRYNDFNPDTALTHHSDLLQLCKTFYFNIFASYFTSCFDTGPKMAVMPRTPPEGQDDYLHITLPHLHPLFPFTSYFVPLRPSCLPPPRCSGPIARFPGFSPLRRHAAHQVTRNPSHYYCLSALSLCHKRKRITKQVDDIVSEESEWLKCNVEERAAKAHGLEEEEAAELRVA
ncbi:hypothetical protein FRC10_008099 [Ceratobasidium sp. 414]|nr:hypothetical protein FRC10_008099 [Ceratobasidium sp. 414]